MYVTKSQIGSNEQTPNVGYVTHLLLIEAEQVLGILDPVRYPNPSNIVPYNGITVKPNTAVTQLIFGDKSCGFQENSAEGSDGILYTITIDALVPGGGMPLNTWLSSAVAKRWIVLLRDSNNHCYLVGEKEAAVRLTYAQVLGAADTTRIGLTTKTWHSCFRLAGIELGLLFPEAHFSYNFSLQFNA